MSIRYFSNQYADILDPKQPLTLGPNMAMERAVQLLGTCVNSCPATPSNFDGCLYTGYLGIAWATVDVLRHRDQLSTETCSLLFSNAAQYVEAALTHLKRSPNPRKMDQLSMLLGYPGVWITAAMLYHRMNNIEARDKHLQAYAALEPQFRPDIVFPEGSDEFFIGRAGYLAGLVTLRSCTGQEVLPDATLLALCDTMVESGLNYARKHRSPCPLMYAYHGTEYLGAGHGIIGILFALMLFPAYLRANPDAERAVQQTLLYLLHITPVTSGNLPSAMDEVEGSHGRSAADGLVHWCHGAAGAILAYARAYLLWKDERFLSECRRCANLVWQKGLLKKGPGICHGVAGSGYVFLLMFRLTGEKFYMHRASMFGHFMLSDTFHQARRPDRPYSLFEGLAGTACFYADLADPCKASFPLMDPMFDIKEK